jgi:protocatechuate 3,4-dioxygenase beta subunit
MDDRRIGRREAIAVFGAALAAGCGGASTTGPTAASAVDAIGTSTAACAVTPAETIGPYPSLADLFRSDIREGRSGTPLTLNLTVVNASSGCAPAAGLNVEIWQCDAAGNYSQYGSQAAQTYLRGIQTTDASGLATFTTIFPGWYQGRATHIHIEVTRNGSSVRATQIAFPESVNDAVYRTGVYASRGSNPTKNVADGIFADSINSELASVSGDAGGALTATFRVAI